MYVIACFKLAKALLLILLALAVWRLLDETLPTLFRQTLLFWPLDPEKPFFVHLGIHLGQISSQNMVWVAAGTVFYSLFSLAEGIGVLGRVG